MRTRHSLNRFVPAALLSLCALAALAPNAAAQETVRVTLPSSVTFNVTDVRRTTTGSPQPTPVRFSDARLTALSRLHISVKADSASFAAPGGVPIPASHVSWTTSGAIGSIGYPGTLSATSYLLVLQSNNNLSIDASGSVDVTWTLAPPPERVRAGHHTMTLRWKIESILP